MKEDDRLVFMNTLEGLAVRISREILYHSLKHTHVCEYEDARCDDASRLLK